jgi:hypothetical protein
MKYSLRTSSDIEFWVVLNKDNLLERMVPLEAFAYRRICLHLKDECIYIFRDADLVVLENLDCYVVGKQGNIVIKKVDCKTFVNYIKLLNED